MRLQNLIVVVISILLCFSCKKNPEACFSVSNSSPSFGETIEIKTDCSKDHKYEELYMDGELVAENFGSFSLLCTDPGEHTLTLKAFSRINGTSNSRSGCVDCSGGGKVSEFSQVINVSGKVAITSNSPVFYDETLIISGPAVPGSSFNWTGPNNFSFNGSQVIIPHATAAASGVYSLVVSSNGKSSVTATIQIVVQAVNAPCATANNQCSFTGGLSGGSCTVLGYDNSGQYELYVSGGAYNVTLRFNKATAPFGGIYTITGNPANIEAHEVYMKVHYNGFIQNTVIGAGKVYVGSMGGKVSADFCAIPFSYNSNNFTITGKVTEP